MAIVRSNYFTAPGALVLTLAALWVVTGAALAFSETEVECGVPRGRTRVIIGGQTATPHEFPWQVYHFTTFRVNGTVGIASCGGSLIDNQWVITAAHCIDEAHPAQIRLGKHNLAVEEEGELLLNISLSVQHPQYNNETDAFDIALVKLNQTVNFTAHPNIRPICLPSKEDFAAFDNKVCTASGWGLTETGRTSNVLKKLSVRVVPFDLCQGFRSLIGDSIDRSVTCGLPTVQVEVCRGDSGGPLQCMRNGRYVLVGDLSLTTCGRSPMPSAYGRISEVIDWINEVRENNA